MSGTLQGIVLDLTQISHNIELAKSDNARWLKYAKDLIEGRTVSKEGLPNVRDECIPCQWLYNHSDEVTRFYRKMHQTEFELVHFDIMEEIEILRYDLHEHYLSVFNTYLPEVNSSFLMNIFRHRRNISEYDRIRAKRLFAKMQQTVDELDSKLDQLERSVYQLCKLNSA